MLGGAVCCNCGCDELKYLEINHINGGGTKELKKIKGTLTRFILSGRRNLKDLNVLCRTCNAMDFLQKKHTSELGFHEVTWVPFRP